MLVGIDIDKDIQTESQRVRGHSGKTYIKCSWVVGRGSRDRRGARGANTHGAI